MQTLLVPSGLAAITLVDMALLKSGDEVLMPDNAYGPSKEFARNELGALGHRPPLLRPDGPGVAGRGDRRPATRLVWLEAPGSVTMEFPDLRGARRRSRARAA